MMKVKYRFYLLAILVFFSLREGVAQEYKTENIFLVTLDGMRWQEVYAGIDSLLLFDSALVQSPDELKHEFWNPNPETRRKLLFPFIWSVVSEQGQLHGNRELGSKVDNSNQLWFSYPGYNELLSGFADDDRITSNDKINNPNVTFLEHLNRMPSFANRVLAYGSWDVFPYIVNSERSGIPVNAGFGTAPTPNPREELLASLQLEIRGPWEEVRLDPFTHHFALEGLKKHHPRVVYIAYGETDDWAHGGNYEQYILSARQTDDYIRELWELIQSDEQYKDKTTLILTTDHGRGIDASGWKGHGARIKESGQVWLGAIGPDTPALGEVTANGNYTPAMIPRTIFELLGLDYPETKAAPAIQDLLK